MPLDTFIEETFSGLEQGHEDVAVGFSKQAWNALEPARLKIYRGMNS